jgi:hypothetical protein
MALATNVYTPGQAPNHSAELMQIALNRPDLYKSFSQGYDEAQKRQLALQQYREAKVKADLAETLYPQQSAVQQALLQQKLQAINTPNQPYSSGSAVTPINPNAPKSVSVTTQDGKVITKDNTTPGSPLTIRDANQAPTTVTDPPLVNPFNGPAPSLLNNQVPAQPLLGSPPISDNSDDSTGLNASDFSANV